MYRFNAHPISMYTHGSHSAKSQSLPVPPVTLEQALAHSTTPRVASFGYSHRRARRRKERYLVIFDWDDTLFPTTMVFGDQRRTLTSSEIHALGKSVYEVLEKYLEDFGAENLFIVTNGSKSWVLESLKIISRQYKDSFDEETDDEKETVNSYREEDYFAAIYNTLISPQAIPIISAQDEHKNRYPQQPTLWKTLSFKSIVKNHFDLYSSSDDNIFCIVSIGDSDDEFKASLEGKQLINTMNRLNRTNNIARLHRIKLKAEPTLKVMMNQLALLRKESDVLRMETGSMTIQYDVKGDNEEKKAMEDSLCLNMDCGGTDPLSL